MRNFKIAVEYDGTDYFGWQRQKDNRKNPTIQHEVEKAFFSVFHKKAAVTASGRTDTGVHALGQCASFRVDTKIPAFNILRAVNTCLPEDIVVTEVKEVPLLFNARFNAKKKWYRYTIINRKIPSAVQRDFMFHCPYRLDVKLMRKAGRIIKGRHDFSTVIPCGDGDKIRKIYKIGVTKEKDFLCIDIIGNGFLYKMARRIVGILLDAGRGKIGLDDVKRLMSGKKISQEIQIAPAKGLCLMKVYY